MLLGPQKVACAPDLEVFHGDAKAGAQTGVLGNGLQSLVRLLGEGSFRGEEEVRVGPLVRPAHASA